MKFKKTTERVSESQNPRAAHIKASEKVTIRSSGASHWMSGVANGRRRCEVRVTLKALRNKAAALPLINTHLYII